jgi:1-phosphofructokinase
MGDIRTLITVGLNPAIDRIVEVPGFRVGGHLPMTPLRRHPAGKAINVSRALAILGRPSIATGFAGQREAAEFEAFLARVAGPRIACRFRPVEGATRENLTILDPQQRIDTHLREPGFTVTADDVARLTAVLDELAEPGVVICFSGSLPPGLSVDQFVAMLSRCIDRGAKVAVDTSGPALASAITLPLWLVKPNREELASISGDSDSPAEAARDLARRITHVLTTLGADGAALVTGDQAWHAHLALDAGQVVNTVGCGDCLLGGFLAALWDGATGDAALQTGVATGAANALALGVGEFDQTTVEALRQRAQVGPWIDR